MTDPLTGLGNRAFLLDRLDHELVRAHRSGREVTVLFLDLDRFKLVNDSLGHHVGHQLLVAAARRLRGCTRVGDVCARLGGDEFSILLGDSSDPVAIAERIIDALQRAFQISGREVFVSVSVGIAIGREDAETMLRNADMAMYRAKRSGAGRYRLYEPSATSCGSTTSRSSSSHPEASPGVQATLHALEEVGVRIALDDFGAGCSSLLNLSCLPIDVIKLARQFLALDDDSVRDPAGMLAGVVALGRHLGMITVAEGIERPEQRELLRRLDCQFGQGFLLGRPASAAAASELLAFDTA